MPNKPHHLGQSEQQDGSFDIYDETTNTIAKVYPHRDAGRARNAAALMTAAPDMLQALTLALQYLDHPDVKAIPFALPSSAAADRIRAAIEKATPRTA